MTQNDQKRSPAWNNFLKAGIIVAVFLVVATAAFQDKGISAEYTDTGVILRGGSSRTEILFEQVQAVEELSTPFELGEPIEAEEKESYFAGSFHDGGLPGEEYLLYLDKVYLDQEALAASGGDGLLLLLRYDEGQVVIGSDTVDMRFLRDYLRSGAGLD